VRVCATVGATPARVWSSLLTCTTRHIGGGATRVCALGSRCVARGRGVRPGSRCATQVHPSPRCALEVCHGRGEGGTPCPTWSANDSEGTTKAAPPGRGARAPHHVHQRGAPTAPKGPKAAPRPPGGGGPPPPPFLPPPAPPPPPFLPFPLVDHKTRATHGGLGLPMVGLWNACACGQAVAVGCGVCDTPELWRGAAGQSVCACTRVCWCRQIFTYIQEETPPGRPYAVWALLPPSPRSRHTRDYNYNCVVNY